MGFVQATGRCPFHIKHMIHAKLLIPLLHCGLEWDPCNSVLLYSVWEGVKGRMSLHLSWVIRDCQSVRYGNACLVHCTCDFHGWLDFTEWEVLQVVILTWSNEVLTLLYIHLSSLVSLGNAQLTDRRDDSPQTFALASSLKLAPSTKAHWFYNHLIHLTWHSTQDSSKDQRPCDSLHQNRNSFKF